MKDFSPHAILRPPSIPDEEVENLIRLSLTSLGCTAPVALLIEPPGPWTQRDEPSLQEPWPVFVKSAGQMSR